MPYDPNKHHRRSIRLQGYDYTNNGAYFITICTAQREWLFGEIINKVMHVNPLGNIVQACWEAIPTHFPRADLDAFVIMPNHVHGIIVLTDQSHTTAKSVGARYILPHSSPSSIPPPLPNIPTHTLPRNPASQSISLPKSGKPPSGAVSNIVGTFKAAVTRQIHRQQHIKAMTIWQRNFHEHIIRNEDELNMLRQYVTINPEQWEQDSLR